MSFSNTPIIRETTAEFKSQNEGEIVSEQIKIRYRSLSVKALKELKQSIREKGEDAYISDNVAALVTELVSASGKSVSPDVDFFEEMDLENLKAIKNAIDGDLDPKPKSASSPAI